MEDYIGNGLLGRGSNFAVVGSIFQYDPFAGLRNINSRQTDEKSNSGYNLKVDQCLYTHLTDIVHIGMAGNANYQRTEDQRRNNGFNKFQEDLAEQVKL